MSWDVFHAESLELERAVSTSDVRTAMARGVLKDDDLVRPAGTTAAWSRLADIPELSSPEARPAEPEPPIIPAPERLKAESKPKPEPRPEKAPPPTAQAEGPPRRGESGDFELEADDIAAPLSTAPVPKIPRPTWLQLGGEPNDVTFPVVRDQPIEPAPPDRSRHEPDSASARAWTWGEVDDDDEPLADEFDEQIEILDDDPAAGLEILDDDELSVPSPSSRESLSGRGPSSVSLPVVPSRDWNEDRHPVEGGDGDGDFTLSRSGPMTVEELDLAPMVDVAFQLVLFFMVTATTVLFKTMEIPKPSTDPPPGAVAQGQSRSLDDFKDDYILVEVDAAGRMKIDHEPVAAELNALAERLRTAREKTGRKAMLLSAEFATPHRHAVLAYDAANEVRLGIAIAKPSAPQGAGPGLLSGSGRPNPARGTAPSAPPADRPVPPPTAPATGGTPFE